MPAIFVQGFVEAHILAQLLAHQHGGFQSAQVETGAHAVRAPELDIVSIVVRFFQHTAVAWIPGLDTVVQALFDLRPVTLQPGGFAADPPLTIDFHYPPELTVAGCVKIVAHATDRQRGAERLVAVFVLAVKVFCVAQAALQAGEQVADCLSVVPDMGTATGATARIVGAALPAPQLPVGLAHGGGAFEDRQVGGYSLDHFGWQVVVVKAIAEFLGLFAQGCVMVFPVCSQFVHIFEPGCIPGDVIAFCGFLRTAFHLFVPDVDSEIALGHIPAQHQPDSFLFFRSQVNRNIQAGSRAGRTLGHRRMFRHRAVYDVFPGDGQRIPPAPSEPAEVGFYTRIVAGGTEITLPPGLGLGPFLSK